MISIIYSLLTLVSVLFIAKLTLDRMYKDANDRVKEQDLDLALTYAGTYFALMIGFIGVQNVIFINQLLESAMLLGFIFASYEIFKKVFVTENNLSFSIFKLGYMTGTGIIAMGAFSGLAPLYSTVMFFILGQMALIAIVFLYKSVFHPTILEKISKNNLSAGMLLAGTLISYSLLLYSAIYGDASTIIEDLKSFLLFAGVGILFFLLFANKFIDHVFLPITEIKDELEEDNLGAILIVVFIKVGFAFLIAMSL